MRVFRENLPGAVYRVEGRSEPAALRWEKTDGRRMLLRQSGRPVLLARIDEDQGGVTLHRRAGYRSPLPPVRADESRLTPDWPRRYAEWLAASADGPLHPGRWMIGRREEFPPYVWGEDLLTEWPVGRLDWERHGWNGVVPARRPSSPDASRVKAYRRQAREGTLAPVLLWWITHLDGWLLLDGHDRAVAALAEDRAPHAVVLEAADDEATLSERYAGLPAYEEEVRTRVFGGPDPERERAAWLRGLSDHAASIPYLEARTRTWPIPGGAAEWDAWMLEFRHAHDRDE